MTPSIHHMLSITSILFLLALGSACQNSSQSGRSGPPAPGGSSGVPAPVDVPGADAPSKITLDSPQAVVKKTEVKAFHTLVRDGNVGYSGYCIASSKKPTPLEDGIRQLEINEGPCPSTIKIDGKNTPIGYACPVRASTSGAKEQVFLYETMNTDLGFQKITELPSDFIDGFCGFGSSNP